MNQASRVQARDRIGASEPFAKLTFDLDDRPRLLRSRSKQQSQDSQDSFLCLLIFLGGHPANLILHGKVLPSLPRPGQLPLRRGTYLIGPADYIPWTVARPSDRQTPRPCDHVPPSHAAFGQAVRELREERGTSQEAFALRCGIDRSHYGGMERGERNPSLTTVYKIADALEVRPSEIHARAEHLQATGARR